MEFDPGRLARIAAPGVKSLQAPPVNSEYETEIGGSASVLSTLRSRRNLRLRAAGVFQHPFQQGLGEHVALAAATDVGPRERYLFVAELSAGNTSRLVGSFSPPTS
jgi:hypothetical protein